MVDSESTDGVALLNEVCPSLDPRYMNLVYEYINVVNKIVYEHDMTSDQQKTGTTVEK